MVKFLLPIILLCISCSTEPEPEKGEIILINESSFTILSVYISQKDLNVLKHENPDLNEDWGKNVIEEVVLPKDSAHISVLPGTWYLKIQNDFPMTFYSQPSNVYARKVTVIKHRGIRYN